MARSWPVLVACLAVALPVSAQIAVRNQGYLPYSDAPINYRSEDLSDPVALLEKEIEQGKVSLTYDQDHGYLRSVLDLLKVPVESQTLVFSKTSFQYPKISPQHPRALYYNDDVYVGSVHQGNAIEIVSFDPRQGAIFYLLDERKVDKPVFQRAELDCTQCHIAAGTRGVPGVLLRSVFATPTGTLTPRAPTYITDQESPFKQRWGGWYVTGALAKASMGNAAAAAAQPAADPASAAAAPGAAPQLSPLDQPFDPSAYLAPGSDQVALLVLTHQAQMHNLITLTNYQTRLALYALAKNTVAGPVQAAFTGDGSSLDALPEATRRQIQKPADQLLRYLLFANETPLGGLNARQEIASSSFAREFAARGVRDSQGRSLRDFDLHDRIFKYPCSYLIYNAAFDTLPEPARGYIYHRLLQVLSGQDHSPDFANLSAKDREAILSILLETKPGLPAEWRDYARARHLKLAALSPAETANPSLNLSTSPSTEGTQP
ncbi:MAG TPA: hypothetical protein VNU69_02915 [Rhizomicrobium sp.]|nr:hypothetical protein [Rhizomicrobium sp.]